MEILLFISGVTFVCSVFLNATLSIIVTLLGIDGMKELCQRNKLDADHINRVFENMFTCIHIGAYFSGVILIAMSSPLDLTALSFVLVVATALIGGVAHFTLATGRHHDQNFHHILYDASQPLSLWAWVVYFIGLTVLDGWCAITGVSFGLLMVANLALVCMKRYFQPHVGWHLLRVTLKHGTLDMHDPSLKSKRKRSAKM